MQKHTPKSKFTLFRYYNDAIRPIGEGMLSAAWPNLITNPASPWTQSIPAFTPLVQLSIRIPASLFMMTLSVIDSRFDDRYASQLQRLFHMIKRVIDAITPVTIAQTFFYKLAGALFTVYQCGHLTQQQCDSSSQGQDNNLLLIGIIIGLELLSIPPFFSSSGFLGRIKNELAHLGVNKKYYYLASTARIIGDTFKNAAIFFGASYGTLLVANQWLPPNPVTNILSGPAIDSMYEITLPSIGTSALLGALFAGLRAKNIGRSLIDSGTFMIGVYAIMLIIAFDTKNNYDRDYEDDVIAKVVRIMDILYPIILAGGSAVILTLPFILSCFGVRNLFWLSEDELPEEKKQNAFRDGSSQRYLNLDKIGAFAAPRLGEDFEYTENRSSGEDNLRADGFYFPDDDDKRRVLEL